MKAEQLRKSILQLAIQGKLVKQDPNDEPASVLLERIRAEKQRLIKEGKIKKDKGDSIIFKGDDNCHYAKIGSEVKNIEDEIDFDLPDRWEYIRLCTVCWLDDIKKSVGEKLPYLDAKTLRGKTDLTYLDEGKIVDVNTKVILVDGENSGEVFDVPFKGYMGSTFKILGASEYFNLQYLNTILDFYKDVFRGNKIGAAIPHLNKNLFKSLIIGLPPIKEQERIVEEIKRFSPVLDEYGRLEQQATKLDTEIYDKLKKSILQYAIQGKLVEQDEMDEPASILLERIRTEKKAQFGKKYVESYIYKGDDNCYYEHIGGKDVNITEEIPFDLPNGWSFERLGNIIDIASGINITSAEMAKTEQLFPVYGGNGINGFYDKFNVESNTIVIGRVGFYCGSVHTTKTKSWVTDNALIVSYSVDNIILPYMELLLRYADFGKKSSSTAQPLVTGKIIRPYVVAIPPLAEQKRIVDKINKIFSKL